MEFWAELHPVFVHFPIAFFTLYAILELLRWFKINNIDQIALFALLLSVVVAVPTLLSGNQAEMAISQSDMNLNQLQLESIENHANYANILIWYFLGMLILKLYIWFNKKSSLITKICFSLLAVIGAVFVYLTGHSGGQLVYKFGFGTELLK